ncbi:hypothetical protein L1987_59004 [Smallanthus sonchifolius]|uniref:Uncharacterized protein n=1 Tax=Smallanthus sonchifolius TaxID=185202 RepID=A0ACB9D437_9ASTR|nr:hypothetical protein L1987_59004 [Smallanthus sonchifolius]
MHQDLYIDNFLLSLLPSPLPAYQISSVLIHSNLNPPGHTHIINQPNAISELGFCRTMAGSCNGSTQPFAKTICSICYEDLKPIAEDLQAISICGHVFHEICIQQWFEYCSKGKKKCPICKQTCTASDVSRLYFQSVGDSNDTNLSQKTQTHKEDPEELKLEVRRLEGRISVLNSNLENRENFLINIIDEFSLCKEQLKTEASLKNEAIEQTHTINSLLALKTQELDKSDLERKKLQERNMALAKELAALKLVSDLDLEDYEIVKLASLGDESHSKDGVDKLAKLVVDRNKSYTKLIAKYKALARDETRLCKELEKAEEKLEELEKLKEKIQKMETAKEMNYNELLRALKVSKKTKDSPSVSNGVDFTFNDTCTPQDTITEPDVYFRKTKRLRVTENILKSNKNDGSSSYIIIDDDAPKVSISPESPVPQPTKSALTDEIGQNEPLFNITNEASLPVRSSQEVDFCFSAGLPGPDGTKRYLGSYCKKGKKDQNKGSNASVSTQSSGDLIAVGADGRGGTVKVLKPLHLPSNDSRGLSYAAKNSKRAAKTSGLHSQGNMQIGHFFSKAGQ